MKNKLADLNNHLFAQLERLSDESLSPRKVALEVQRAGAIVSVAEQIVRGADLNLKAVALMAVHGDRLRPLLPMIGSSES